MGVAGTCLATHGGQHDLVTVDCQFLGQRSAFPTLEVAHHTAPFAPTFALEHEDIILRVERFKEEDLDLGAGFLAELYAGVDHAGIVAD